MWMRQAPSLARQNILDFRLQLLRSFTLSLSLSLSHLLFLTQMCALSLSLFLPLYQKCAFRLRVFDCRLIVGPSVQGCVRSKEKERGGGRMYYFPTQLSQVQSDSLWRFEAVIRTTTTFAVRSVQDLLFRRTDFYVFWNFLKRKFSLKRQFWRQRLSFKKGECKNRRFLWNRWNRFAIFRDVENDVSDDDDVSVAQRDVTQCPCSRRCEKIQKLSRFWLDCAVVTFD